MKEEKLAVTHKQVEAIRAFALRKYSELDYTHGENHAERTVRLAEYIAIREGADVNICKLAALLHQYHPEEARKVDEFLKKIGLKENLRGRIVHCIETVSRSTIHRAKTLEAKIVFDADKLQIIGPFGIIRQVVYFIQNEGDNFHSALEKTKKIQIDVYNLLQTDTAKKLAAKPHRLALEFFRVFEQWDKVSF